MRNWSIEVWIAGTRYTWKPIRAANPWTAIMRALRGLKHDDDPAVVAEFKQARSFQVNVRRDD